jgi:hypothetical protein
MTPGCSTFYLATIHAFLRLIEKHNASNQKVLQEYVVQAKGSAVVA